MPLIPISIAEREHKKIPLSYILRGNELDLIPEVTSGKYITIRLSSDSLDVQATKYIGYVPLNSQYVLHITPKFGISNLLKLLAESKGDSHALEFFERSYRSLFDPNRTLIDFFALCLEYELNLLAQRGMWREYLPKSSISAFPAGKISLAPTVLQSWVRGDTDRLHLERFELSKDTIANRLIKYAIWLLTSPLADYTGLERKTIRSLNSHLPRFNRVKLDHSLSFIRSTEHLIQTKAFPRIRPYYVRLCQISLYILKTLGLDILHSGAGAILPSFVIDLEATFEMYMLHTLQRELPKILDNVQILDGNMEGSRELFVNRRGYPMKPDIVVLKENNPVLTADVKYKAEPAREDRSQVVTYAVGYGTSRSLLLCPASGGQRQGLRPLGLVNNQIQVDEYYFDLAAEDLILEEQKLAQVVADLVK